MNTTHSRSLFDVDPVGMRKVFDHRGVSMAIYELVSNGLDTHATTIEVTLESIDRDHARVVVRDDDPDGFVDLRHAYTLFAESIRKDDPTTRGRYNLGEKLVIVLCSECEIATTTGTLRFDADGRTQSDARTERGSVFTGTLSMTAGEVEDALALLGRLIVPDGVTVTINGMALAHRVPLRTFREPLITVLGDVLRRTERVTTVAVYEPLPGFAPTLYELGVPVVATGDRFDIDVHQKVPLNTERDNVTAGFLRHLRMVTLNHTADLLSADEARAGWVTTGIEHPKVSATALNAVLDARFGERRVIYDATDREASKIAVAEGYTVMPPGALSKEAWRNVRDHEAALPAGRVTPSPSAVVNAKLAEGNTDTIPEEKWSAAERHVAAYARAVGNTVLGFTPTVAILSDISLPMAAMYSAASRTLTFNRGRLGRAWFNAIGRPTDALLLHEFAHHRVADHLSAEYADEVARLAAILLEDALTTPETLLAFRNAAAVAASVGGGL